MRLFEHWQLSAAEQAAVLGLSVGSRTTLARYRSGEPLADNRDLLDRAGHLLGMHKSLRLLFPHDRDLAYRWMTAPNRRSARAPSTSSSSMDSRACSRCGATSTTSAGSRWTPPCSQRTSTSTATWSATFRASARRRTCSTT